MNERVRPPAVAGAFYPAGRDELVGELRRSFAAARQVEADAPVPKAIVVPHAGFVFSGPIAASAYARVVPARATIQRVVLLGPSHRAPLDGIAVPSVDAFRTPLGDVPIDAEARLAAVDAGARVDDLAHAYEHSLEVQLPFLQVALDGFELLPLAVGWCDAELVGAVLDAVWGGPETLVVVSTDLSHYHRYADAVALDQRTAGAIASARPDLIDDRDACGAYGLRPFLQAVRSRQLSIELLDLRNSGDTAGDRERVVGYAAFAVR